MVAHLCFDPSVTLVVDAQPPALDYLLWNKVELFCSEFFKCKGDCSLICMGLALNTYRT